MVCLVTDWFARSDLKVNTKKNLSSDLLDKLLGQMVVIGTKFNYLGFRCRKKYNSVLLGLSIVERCFCHSIFLF